jgi:hypothetical protein
MPAWIAGIQVRRMRPETSMSTWIPALLAGKTDPPRVLRAENQSSKALLLKRDLGLWIAASAATIGAALTLKVSESTLVGGF